MAWRVHVSLAVEHEGKARLPSPEPPLPRLLSWREVHFPCVAVRPVRPGTCGSRRQPPLPAFCLRSAGVLPGRPRSRGTHSGLPGSSSGHRQGNSELGAAEGECPSGSPPEVHLEILAPLASLPLLLVGTTCQLPASPQPPSRSSPAHPRALTPPPQLCTPLLSPHIPWWQEKGLASSSPSSVISCALGLSLLGSDAAAVPLLLGAHPGLAADTQAPALGLHLLFCTPVTLMAESSSPALPGPPFLTAWDSGVAP